MLVLTRKPSDTIKIGDHIVIKVLCLGTKSVRIGIEAPDSVRVLRGELTELVAEDVMISNDEPESPAIVAPFVADAVTDCEPVEEPVVLGPMTVEKFLAEFQGDWLPGRSIRRKLGSRQPLKSVAK